MSEKVILGDSGLSVTPICYGTWQLSPKFWGKQPEKEHIHAMQQAFDLGINFYDTAGAYGDGLSETILGKALKDLPREKIVIATKVYHHFYPDGHRHPDLSKNYIIAECEQLLKRLQTDYVDLLQCHAFDPFVHPAETTEAMEILKKQGKIRAYGVSNYTVSQFRLSRKYGQYTTSQPLYNLLETDAEKEMLPFCLENNIGVLVYSPLAKGLLTGKYDGTETFADFRAHHPHFQGDTFKKLCANIQQLETIAGDYGMSTPQLILTATLMNPAITCAIVGIKTRQHIETAAGVLGKTISREDYFKIRTILSM